MATQAIKAEPYADGGAAATIRTDAPGPRGLPVLGVFLKVRDDPLSFSLETARRYGDIAQFRLGPYRVFMLNRPEYFQQVLESNYRKYCKSEFYKAVGPIFGNGLVTAEGEHWRRQRQLAQPAFHRKHLSIMARNMTAAMDRMLTRWSGPAREGRPIDILAETMNLALDNIAEAMFSTDVEGEFQEINDSIGVILRRAEKVIWSPIPLPYHVPTPRNLKTYAAERRLNRTVYRVIDERRRSGEEKGDLLSMLVGARYEDTGEAMDDKQLRDEVLTILIAGHETVGTTAAYTLYLVSKHPDVEKRLRAELKDVLRSRTPTMEDLPDLPYHSQVIHETLRLYPAAWTISRTAIEDDEIGGCSIPKGAAIMLSPYVLHRNTEYWPNPEAFDPERFAPAQVADRHRYAFVPFGGGPRGCIGKNFALMEVQLLLAMTLQRYRMEIEPGYKMELEPMISLRPINGIRMHVRALN